jgi:hypothetical protein
MKAAVLEVKHPSGREGHRREPNAFASATKAVCGALGQALELGEEAQLAAEDLAPGLVQGEPRPAIYLGKVLHSLPSNLSTRLMDGTELPSGLAVYPSVQNPPQQRTPTQIRFGAP